MKIPHPLAVPLGALLGALVVVQQAAITMPSWAHAVIAFVIVVLGTLGISPSVVEADAAAAVIASPPPAPPTTTPAGGQPHV